MLSPNFDGPNLYFPYYPNLQTDQIEYISRTIEIEENIITISTEIENGKDLQVLIIKKKVMNNGILTIYCTSKDEVYPTIILIPIKDKIDEIQVIQPTTNGTGEELFRFLLD